MTFLNLKSTFYKNKNEFLLINSSSMSFSEDDYSSNTVKPSAVIDV